MLAALNIEQLDIRDADNRLLARLETDASLAENPLFTLHLRPTPTPLLRASSQAADKPAIPAPATAICMSCVLVLAAWGRTNQYCLCFVLYKIDL